MFYPSTGQSLFPLLRNNLFHLVYFPPIAILLSSFLLPNKDAIPSWQNNCPKIFFQGQALHPPSRCQYLAEKNVQRLTILLPTSKHPYPNQIPVNKDVCVYRSESLRQNNVICLSNA